MMGRFDDWQQPLFYKFRLDVMFPKIISCAELPLCWN